MQSVQILSSMDAYERSKLGDAVKEENFAKGEYIITQGATGDNFFMISEGNATATILQKDGTTQKIMEYGKG